jgi:hypothetical protein
LLHVIQDMDSVKTIVGRPMEVEHVALSSDQISEWFARLSAIVQDIPREFILNVDETGCSDCTDSREVRVIAPIAYPEPRIPVPSDRDSKRSTFVAYLATHGFRMTPLVIVPRVTAEK